ncbi:MAG: hypothetical protein JW874_12190 [Spirochaetales bacterium]|nr:hypothetical protein [Spirochaetales bacterium]
MNKKKASVSRIVLLMVLLFPVILSCSDQLMGLIEEKIYFDEHGFYPFKNEVYREGTLFHSDDARYFASAAFSDNSVLLVYQDSPNGPNNSGRAIIGEDGSVSRTAAVFSIGPQCYAIGAGQLADGRTAAIYHYSGEYRICVFQSDGTIDNDFPVYATTFHENMDSRPVLLCLPDGDLFFIGLQDTPRGFQAARINTGDWTFDPPYMAVTSIDVAEVKAATVLADGNVLLAYMLSDSSPMYCIIDPETETVSPSESLNASVDAGVSAVLRLADDRIMIFVDNEIQLWMPDMSLMTASRQLDDPTVMNLSAAPTLDGGAVAVYRVFDDGSRPRYRHIDGNLQLSSAEIIHQEDCYYTAASLRPDGKVLIAYSYNMTGDHRSYYMILE